MKRFLSQISDFKPDLLQSEVVKGGQLLSKNSSEIVLKWFQAKSPLGWDLLSELGSIVDSREKFWRKNSWRHERRSKFKIVAYEAIFKPNLLQSEVVKVCIKKVEKCFKFDFLRDFFCCCMGNTHQRLATRSEERRDSFESTIKRQTLKIELLQV